MGPDGRGGEVGWVEQRVREYGAEKAREASRTRE